MAYDQSESPKERINVTYKPATGDSSEEIEIPYRMLVLGEFNPDEAFETVEDRKAINVTKSNFNDVLQKQNISLDLSVDNKLNEEEGTTLETKLKISSMKDFSPENIVEQVDELKKLQELRESLMALKGPLGNIPAFRKAIAAAIENPDEASALLEELGIQLDDEGEQ